MCSALFTLLNSHRVAIFLSLGWIPETGFLFPVHWIPGIQPRLAVNAPYATIYTLAFAHYSRIFFWNFDGLGRFHILEYSMEFRWSWRGILWNIYWNLDGPGEEFWNIPIFQYWNLGQRK